MSIVKSFSVGNGDMFYIKHNSNNFTIIDCSLSLFNRVRIIEELRRQSQGVDIITRFVSTHPDDDHICGFVYLDDQMNLVNFYCVENACAKDPRTQDFDRYCALRDSEKSFKMQRGIRRKWLNLGDEQRGNSGINILWPTIDDADYQIELFGASLGLSPNNISTVITYTLENGATVMWMGDLETVFMEMIADRIDWPKVDILFAPHHGRESGRIPAAILEKLSPKLVVIGEAPAEHLCYYPDCDTITQNSVGKN